MFRRYAQRSGWNIAFLALTEICKQKSVNVIGMEAYNWCLGDQTETPPPSQWSESMNNVMLCGRVRHDTERVVESGDFTLVCDSLLGFIP